MPQNAPAQQAMTYYYDITKNTKKIPGRQRITIALVLHEDILKTNNKFPLKSLLTIDDLNVAREIAMDRKIWKEVVESVYRAVQVEEEERNL